MLHLRASTSKSACGDTESVSQLHKLDIQRRPLLQTKWNCHKRGGQGNVDWDYMLHQKVAYSLCFTSRIYFDFLFHFPSKHVSM